MRQFGSRLYALEQVRAVRHIDLSHVPDESLHRMEAITSRSMLDWTRADVELMQQYGFLRDFEVGEGRVRDWCSPGDAAEIVAWETSREAR